MNWRQKPGAASKNWRTAPRKLKNNTLVGVVPISAGKGRIALYDTEPGKTEQAAGELKKQFEGKIICIGKVRCHSTRGPPWVD